MTARDPRSPSAAPLPNGNATNVLPPVDLFAPCGVCGHDPKNVVLDPQVWVKIVFAARESEDWLLRTLIEQAVMGVRP